MKAKNAKRDIILYICLAIASLVVYYWIIPTQIHMNSTAKQEAFNPDTFPRFITIVFFLACVAGAANAARMYMQARKEEGPPEKRPRAKRTAREVVTALMPYIIFLLTLCYGILFKVIGFVPATAIMMPVILLVIGCKKWHYYVIVLAVAAALYALFRFVLHVPIR